MAIQMTALDQFELQCSRFSLALHAWVSVSRRAARLREKSALKSNAFRTAIKSETVRNKPKGERTNARKQTMEAQMAFVRAEQNLEDVEKDAARRYAQLVQMNRKLDAGVTQ
jgi:hypothetical protein